MRLAVDSELAEARKQVEAIEYQTREQEKQRADIEVELQKFRLS